MSHTSTKRELTECLSAKLFKVCRTAKGRICCCLGKLLQDHIETFLEYKRRSTKIILHATDAVKHGATEIIIYLHGTLLSLSSLRRYPQMFNSSSRAIPSDAVWYSLSLLTIVECFVELKAGAFPDLHALRGADVTSCFAN